MRRALVAAAPLALAAVAGCNNNFDPASFVDKLRLLAVKAEPPDMPAGMMSTLTATAANPGGAAPTITWDACLLPPPPATGQGVNQDCVGLPEGDPSLVPFGQGDSVTATMPTLSPSMIGLPDQTNGFYLPVRLRARRRRQHAGGLLPLRIFLGALTPNAPNQNPALTGIFIVPVGRRRRRRRDADRRDQRRPPVHASDQLSPARAGHAGQPGDVRQVFDGDPRTTPPRTVTETVRISWFTTAGHFDQRRHRRRQAGHHAHPRQAPAAVGHADRRVGRGARRARRQPTSCTAAPVPLKRRADRADRQRAASTASRTPALRGASSPSRPPRWRPSRPGRDRSARWSDVRAAPPGARVRHSASASRSWRGHGVGEPGVERGRPRRLDADGARLCTTVPEPTTNTSRARNGASARPSAKQRHRRRRRQRQLHHRHVRRRIRQHQRRPRAVIPAPRARRPRRPSGARRPRVRAGDERRQSRAPAPARPAPDTSCAYIFAGKPPKS